MLIDASFVTVLVLHMELRRCCLFVCVFFGYFSKDKRADKWARWSRSVDTAKFQLIHVRWAGHGGHGNWSGCGSRWDGGRGLRSFQLQSSWPRLRMDLECLAFPSNKSFLQNVTADGDLIFSCFSINGIYCRMDMYIGYTCCVAFVAEPLPSDVYSCCCLAEFTGFVAAKRWLWT